MAKYLIWRKGMKCNYYEDPNGPVTISDCITLCDPFVWWGRGYGEMVIMIDKHKGAVPLKSIGDGLEQLELAL